MKLKESIKLRKEDEFYLLINLDSESILKGYPSFFKINNIGEKIVKLIEKTNYSKEEIVRYILNNREYKCTEEAVLYFLDFLERYDLCDK